MECAVCVPEDATMDFSGHNPTVSQSTRSKRADFAVAIYSPDGEAEYAGEKARFGRMRIQWRSVGVHCGDSLMG